VKHCLLPGEQKMKQSRPEMPDCLRYYLQNGIKAGMKGFVRTIPILVNRIWVSKSLRPGPFFDHVGTCKTAFSTMQCRSHTRAWHLAKTHRVRALPQTRNLEQKTFYVKTTLMEVERKTRYLPFARASCPATDDHSNLEDSSDRCCRQSVHCGCICAGD
jgi:hypothetical protein